jgi:hypothetical protein
MSFLKGLFANDKKLEQTFMEAMDHFANKEYAIAYKKFLKTYKSARSNKIKLHCLLNASTSAENLNEKIEAGIHLVSAAKLQCELKEQSKDIAESLEKAYILMTKDVKKINYDDIWEIIAPLMLFKIIVQDKNFLTKLSNNLKEVNVTHPHNIFALETYSNFIDHPEKIWEKDNFIIFPDQFPKEFTTYVRSVQDVIRGSAALSINLTPNKLEVKPGDQISIKAKISNHTPLLIEKLYLQPGSKGQFIKTSFDNKRINLTENKNLEYDFLLEPHLTGQWFIGPLIIHYHVNGVNFETKSDILKVNVLPGKKELKLDLDFSIVEEDFEFEFKSYITNSGETPLENIKVLLKIPSTGKFTEGAPERTIYELRNGEKIEFANRVRFESGILGKQHKIKLQVDFDETSIDKELILASGVLTTN